MDDLLKSSSLHTCLESCVVLSCLHEDTSKQKGTAVAQWLRRCATNRKVAGSIPAGVIGIFR